MTARKSRTGIGEARDAQRSTRFMFGWALGSTQMIQNTALLVGPRGLGGPVRLDRERLRNGAARSLGGEVTALYGC